MENSKLIEQIKEKYEKLGENPETHLKGLLTAKPINYWDYLHIETLLSLQNPRTDFKDEEIFIMYHQMTELVLKMIVHEVKQIVSEPDPSDDYLITKISRVNRYTKLLITSFAIMKDGMDYDDYNIFRNTLTPASGFQSAQFRFIELYCTRLSNLVSNSQKDSLDSNATMEQRFEKLYWKDAGLNRKTGKKTLTLTQFEKKYQQKLMTLAQDLEGKTIEDKLLLNGQPGDELIKVLKRFDYLYNVKWPIVHLGTAQHYLDSKGENKQATGGSEWKKYLHPAYQQRRFFPSLWSEEELADWGNLNLEQ
ncbi:MAG TPA: tryptophan 2,3-dioxygenase family protein [Fulvivirga sp.]|nr:tryptophan 2,3-dioxygenase family protein [Fulvivirga sp.]